MKKQLLLFFTLCLSSGWAQVFHFDQDSTALIKNVNQSPAHWYLEIFNDVGVDTTLRWKCHYVNIPSQWDANFDDQNVLHPVVNDGDSSDFILYSGLSLPQKLIIGAAFNGTPGVGSYLFDIYDPYTPTDITTIEYHYIVGQADLNEIGSSQWLKRNGDLLIFDESIVGNQIVICTFLGKTVFHGEVPQMLELPVNREGLIYRVEDKKHTLILKEVL